MCHMYLGQKKGRWTDLGFLTCLSVTWQVNSAKCHVLPHASASLTTVVGFIIVSNFPAALRNLFPYACKRKLLKLCSLAEEPQTASVLVPCRALTQAPPAQGWLYPTTLLKRAVQRCSLSRGGSEMCWCGAAYFP